MATLPEASRRRGLCDQGALVAANASLLCYSIKSSIRVIHRTTGARALIKVAGAPGRATPQVLILCAGGGEGGGGEVMRADEGGERAGCRLVCHA